MSMEHMWEEKLTEGLKTENKVLKDFIERGYEVIPATDSEQRSGIDLYTKRLY